MALAEFEIEKEALATRIIVLANKWSAERRFESESKENWLEQDVFKPTCSSFIGDNE
jgi:hypothetical protein